MKTNAHSVALLSTGDVRTDLFDDTCAVKSTEERVRDHRRGKYLNFPIRGIECSGDDLHEHLVVFELGQFSGLDSEGSIGPLEDGHSAGLVVQNPLASLDHVGGV